MIMCDRLMEDSCSLHHACKRKTQSIHSVSHAWPHLNTLTSHSTSSIFKIHHTQLHEHLFLKKYHHTYHSCCGSSMTRRILDFLPMGTGVCSTSPAEAAVCFTTLVMELKNPAPEGWAAGWSFLSGFGFWFGETWGSDSDAAPGEEGWGGSGFCRSER